MKRRTLAAYVVAVEGIAFAASLGALAAALTTAAATIRADYASARGSEAKKAELILDAFVERELRLFAGLSRAERLPDTVFLAEAFSDLYLVTDTGRVGKTILAQPASAVYEGFDLAFGPPGDLLDSATSAEPAISGIVRGVEDERPSIYLAARRQGGWILGRVRIDRIVAELARFAEYRDEIIVLAAVDGRILSSTRPDLGLDLLPDGTKAVTALGREWLASERLNAALGDRIVVLTLPDELNEVLGAITFIGPLLTGILLAAAALRTRELKRRVLSPLARFARTLDEWGIEPGPEPLVEESLLEFGEVATLRHAFALKGLEIQRAVNELKRRDAEVIALNAALEDRVRERTASLEAANAELGESNAELSRALRDLRVARDRLLDAEKLAAVGRLAAGTAHELNSPLGAIRSSAEHVCGSLSAELAHLPEFLAGLEPDERRAFGLLLSKSSGRDLELSPKRQRDIRADILSRFSEARAGAEALADYLAEIGLAADDDVAGFFALSRLPEIVERASELSGLERAARVIIAGVDAASRTVEALRSFVGSDGTDDPVRVDLVAVIEAALERLHGKLGASIELVRDYDGDLLVFGRPRELEQVWLNLIDNAVDAMRGAGRLEVAARRKGDEVLASIADSGPGIPDAVKERLFAPFFTTKSPQEGIGLGLDLCRRLLEAHGGSIDFTSRPGRTVFTVRLPSYREGEIGGGFPAAP